MGSPFSNTHNPWPNISRGWRIWAVVNTTRCSKNTKIQNYNFTVQNFRKHCKRASLLSPNSFCWPAGILSTGGNGFWRSTGFVDGKFLTGGNGFWRSTGLVGIGVDVADGRLIDGKEAFLETVSATGISRGVFIGWGWTVPTVWFAGGFGFSFTTAYSKR